jgi:hypothetical protein
MSEHNPLNLVKINLAARAVVQLHRSRRFVSGNVLGVFQR